jgi:uncharacterized protein YaaW (UPF0174 family)|tara:strand:+ start:31 stop:246 length:216 start_codon:yes stop_codon:yes gene_type:complete
VKKNQSYFTKKHIKNPYIKSVITDKINKPTPDILTENELRKLSDEELNKYCSKIIKITVESYMEVEEYQQD